MFVIFVIIESGQEDRFLTILNPLFDNTLSFTIEKEVGGRLPFLDSLVIRSSDCFKTTVYRKPTHSDRYLYLSSHCPQAVMRAVVHGMTRRAVAPCEPDVLAQELKHIYNTFKDTVIHHLLCTPLYGEPWQILQEYKEEPSLAHESYSPHYVSETSSSLTRRFRELMKHLHRYKRAEEELEGTSSPQTTLRGRPRTVHPTLAMEQPLAAAAVAEHAAHCRGSLQTRVVCKESRLSRRRLEEAFFIQNNQYTNRDRGIVEPDEPLPEPDEHELGHVLHG
ncbi:hypothetical protein M513_09292 [Trichuris suis]|uniref:Helix-turn-helix domain-containing protein n=1 Tax=Trichuris suis TaxID=68888 RepID=A0A085LXX9_9BILA|nr:hypothetical protein M513_09292 [Trichuris suis]